MLHVTLLHAASDCQSRLELLQRTAQRQITTPCRIILFLLKVVLFYGMSLCSECGAFYISNYEITGGRDISIAYTEPSTESGPIYFIALPDVQARTGMQQYNVRV